MAEQFEITKSDDIQALGVLEKSFNSDQQIISLIEGFANAVLGAFSVPTVTISNPIPSADNYRANAIAFMSAYLASLPGLKTFLSAAVMTDVASTKLTADTAFDLKIQNLQTQIDSAAAFIDNAISGIDAKITTLNTLKTDLTASIITDKRVEWINKMGEHIDINTPIAKITNIHYLENPKALKEIEKKTSKIAKIDKDISDAADQKAALIAAKTILINQKTQALSDQTKKDTLFTALDTSITNLGV